MWRSITIWWMTLAVLVLWCLPCTAQAPVYTVNGVDGAAGYGENLAAIGDIDGDGAWDFAVGQPGYHIGVVGHGLVQVVSGKTGAQIYEFIGQPYAGLGSVAGLGDVDGDSIPDFAMGALGSVQVVSGATGAVLYTLKNVEVGSGFGSTVAGAGDVDADGVGDLVIGAPNAQGYLGQAWVFSGKNGSLLHVFTGVQNTSPTIAGFGRALAGIGDVDRDGHDDVAVGAFGQDPGGSGSVRVYSGRTGEILWTQLGNPGWLLGASIARVGSAADGTPILAIGAVGGPSLPGFVRIVSGSDGSVIATLAGSQNQSYFGAAIAALGDYDLDGVDDIVVGAPGESVIYLVSGSDFSSLATVLPTVYSSQGQSLAGLSDLNGDGIPDFVTGSALNNLPPNTGYVRVYLGGWSAPSTYCTAKVNSQGCTPEIASSGAPSLTVGDAFHVLATRIVNSQFGILVWSAAPDVKPFFGGTLCLASPVIRASVQWSGGSPPPAVDCTGSFDFHFSQAYMGQFLIAPGMTLHGQYWYRDPFHPDGLGVGLTDALAFETCP